MSINNGQYVEKADQTANLPALPGIPTPFAYKKNIPIRQRFFASLPDGANYRTRTPLTAAPAWTLNEAVQAGIVRSNAGNDYVVCGGYAGTCTTAPTGTGNAGITDGTIKWLYMGSSKIALPDTSDVPIVTFQPQDASATSNYPVSDGTNNIALGNGILLSGHPSLVLTIPFGGGNAVTVPSYGGSQGKEAFSATIMTDSPYLGVNSFQKFGAGFSYPVNINGYDLLPYGGISAYQLAQSSGASSMNLDWRNKPNKIRKVKTYLSNNTFTGFCVPPQYQVWLDVKPYAYNLYVEGDSFAQGGAPANGVTQRAYRLGMMLGCDNVYASGQGTTGFLTGGVANNYISRAPLVVAAKADILYLCPYHWDNNNQGYTSAQRIAAYIQYFEYFLNPVTGQLKDLIILMAGATGNYSSDAAIIDADVKSAITSYGHPHVKFIPSNPDIINGKSWETGDGNVFTVGTVQGNSQWLLGNPAGDGHPNVRYLEYIQWREYYAICNAMASIAD